MVSNQKKYKTYYKTAYFNVAGASRLYVLVDEHPDSINAGGYTNMMVENPAQARIIDYPASYHNGACGFGFSDGHSEIHKWLEPQTKVPVTTRGYTSEWQAINPKSRDLQWLYERSTARR